MPNQSKTPDAYVGREQAQIKHQQFLLSTAQYSNSLMLIVLLALGKLMSRCNQLQ
jgi:hypothetical protein